MKETQTQARRRALLKKYAKRLAASALCVALLIPLLCISAYAEPIFTVDLGSGEAGRSFGLLDALLLVALLALAPSILIMVTSFLRIIIVLSFVRSAMGTQQSPPNQVLIGLALFLTLLIMSPVLTQIKEQAYEPYRAGEITQAEALERAEGPLKEFMLKETYVEDINLFLAIAKDRTGLEFDEAPDNEALKELSLTIVVPAFATSELKRAFTMGFMIFIPTAGASCSALWCAAFTHRAAARRAAPMPWRFSSLQPLVRRACAAERREKTLRF